MIQTILQKCLDNLNAETPDLSYVRGMMEVLLAMQPVERHDMKLENNTLTISKVFPAEEQPKDEGAMLDATAKANLEKIKAISEKSLE